MRQTCSIWKKNNMAPQPNFNCAIKLLDPSNTWKPMLCTDDMVKSADGDKAAYDKLKGRDYKCSKKDKEILLRVVMQAPVEGDKDYDKDYAAAYTSGSPYTILASEAVLMGDLSKPAGEYADANPYFKLNLNADGTEAKAAVEDSDHKAKGVKCTTKKHWDDYGVDCLPAPVAKQMSGCTQCIDESIRRARTTAFISLVWAEGFRAYCSRSFDNFVWVNTFNNPSMNKAVAMAQVTLVLALFIPGLNTVLGLYPYEIHGFGIFLALVGSVSCLIGCEAYKFFGKAFIEEAELANYEENEDGTTRQSSLSINT